MVSRRSQGVRRGPDGLNRPCHRALRQNARFRSVLAARNAAIEKNGGANRSSPRRPNPNSMIRLWFF